MSSLRIRPTGPGEVPCVPNVRLFDAAGGLLGPDDVLPASETAEAREACRLLCEGCPMFARCVRDAATQPLVDGFVGGMTRPERKRLKEALRVPVETLSVSRLAGAPGKGSTVSRVDLERMVTRHPEWEPTQVAEALGCSVSTVTRFQQQRSAGEVTGARVRLPEHMRATEAVAAYREHIAA